MAGEVKEKKDMTKKAGSLDPNTPIQVPKTDWEKFSDQLNKPQEEWSSTRDVERQMPNLMEWAEKSGAADLVHNANAVAPRVENAPVESIAPEVKPEDAPIEQEPDERLGLAGQVTTAPTAPNLGVAPLVDEDDLAKENEVPDSPLAALYKQLNPEPKQRTPEEEAEYQRQRKATNIIMGISDAINGLSNLGATMAGAPSRNIDSLTGKWNEALNAAEQERQKKSAIWREGYLKAALEDYKNAQALAKEQRERGYKKEDQAEALRQQKELKRLGAELDKSAREHAAGIRSEQTKVEHENSIKLAQERGKQDRLTAGVRASVSASNAADKADNKKPSFATTIANTPVDVVVRKESDYSALFDLIKSEVEKSNDDGGKASLNALNLILEKDAGDKVKSAAHKKGYVMENFAKYYDKIKDNPMYKHLSVELRDGAGNAVEFKPAEQKPAPDITERINATQKAIKENNPARKNKDKVKGVGMATEGPLMSSVVVPTYVSGGVEKIQWYNE